MCPNLEQGTSQIQVTLYGKVFWIMLVRETKPWSSARKFKIFVVTHWALGSGWQQKSWISKQSFKASSCSRAWFKRLSHKRLFGSVKFLSSDSDTLLRFCIQNRRVGPRKFEYGEHLALGNCLAQGSLLRTPFIKKKKHFFWLPWLVKRKGIKVGSGGEQQYRYSGSNLLIKLGAWENSFTQENEKQMRSTEQAWDKSKHCLA